MKILPGDAPMLNYNSIDFDHQGTLEDIVNEIEEKC